LEIVIVLPHVASYPGGFEIRIYAGDAGA